MLLGKRKLYKCFELLGSKSEKIHWMKNALKLSTMQLIMRVAKDDGKKKPAIYKFYDYTKGGSDIVDQQMGFHTCKTKSWRWTSTAFWYVLDVCRVNAATVFALNHKHDLKKLNTYNFYKM